jgi:hypothetical protein
VQWHTCVFSGSASASIVIAPQAHAPFTFIG